MIPATYKLLHNEFMEGMKPKSDNLELRLFLHYSSTLEYIYINIHFEVSRSSLNDIRLTEIFDTKYEQLRSKICNS